MPWPPRSQALIRAEPSVSGGVASRRIANRVDSFGREPQNRVPIRLDQVDDGSARSFAPIIACIECLLRCLQVLEIVVGADKKIAVTVVERRAVRDNLDAPRA